MRPRPFHSLLLMVVVKYRHSNDLRERNPSFAFVIFYSRPSSCKEDAVVFLLNLSHKHWSLYNTESTYNFICEKYRFSIFCPMNMRPCPFRSLLVVVKYKHSNGLRHWNPSFAFVIFCNIFWQTRQWWGGRCIVPTLCIIESTYNFNLNLWKVQITMFLSSEHETLPFPFVVDCGGDQIQA